MNLTIRTFIAAAMIAILAQPAFAGPPEIKVSRLSTGTVIPNRSVTLSSKLMGRVVTITRDDGQSINKGELLLSIADGEYRAGVKSAEAQVGLAKADLQFKKTTADRMRRLFKEQSLSQGRLDEAELAEAVAGENVKKAEAALISAKAMLREAAIYAPFSGVVIEKKVELGQMTIPGAPLFVLEDHSKLKLLTSVKERDVPFIHKGQSVEVTIDALADVRLTGKVGKIIPSGDPATHTYKVEVLLPKHDSLFVGMFGKADFTR